MTTGMWLALAGCMVGAGAAATPGGIGHEKSLAPNVEAHVEVLTRTEFGRTVEITHLHAANAPTLGPALLIVAGLDPRSGDSSELATRVGKLLQGEHAAALAR